MAGLRVYHPTWRNGVFEVPLAAKTKKGKAKRIKLTFDSYGYSLVSDGVWAELLEAAKAFDQGIGLLVVNEVPDPPAQVLAIDGTGELRETWRLGPDGQLQQVERTVTGVTVDRSPNITIHGNTITGA